MRKRYYGSACLVFLGCIVAMAFIGCGGKVDETKTTADSGSERDDTTAAIIERLEANGFVCVKRNERYLIYRKPDVMLHELCENFDFKSPINIRVCANHSSRINIADNIYCVMEASEMARDSGLDPLSFPCCAYVIISRNPKVVPTVLKIGTEYEDACRALMKAMGTKCISMEMYIYGEDQWRVCELPDGTRLAFLMEVEFAQRFIVAIGIESDGGIRRIEEFDLGPFMLAEGE